MNVHQLVLPNNTIIVPNVSILETQTMNLGIGYITIPIDY
jgi:hypothetical protein